jgi:hypothetical protein
MSERKQSDRWRCLVAGCNPVLDEKTAAEHKAETEHRVALWPVRSAAGRKKATQRNRNGYYDKYNVGAKSAAARGITSEGKRGRPVFGGYGSRETFGAYDDYDGEF